MRQEIWPPKDPAEVIVAAFDFSAEVGSAEQVTGAPLIEVALISGIDPAPSAMRLGSPVLADGAVVRQALSGGVAGCTYKIRCQVTLDSGRVLVLAATLPVRTA